MNVYKLAYISIYRDCDIMDELTIVIYIHPNIYMYIDVHPWAVCTQFYLKQSSYLKQFFNLEKKSFFLVPVYRTHPPI